MKKMSIKTVVAIGIGAALFFVLGRFVAIPSGIPNTNFTIQYAILALFAVLYGPIAGGLIGLIGHSLIDLSWGGSPWWSWVLASVAVGIIIGLVANKLNVEEGKFNGKSFAIYAAICVIANAIAWGLVAPGLDVFIYAEPASKVFAQGAMAGLINIVATLVVGGLLLLAYAKTRTKKGSLSKD